MMIASNGQYSAHKPQFIQISTSMKNSVGSGMGRPVCGSFERTIQIHCGGQTFAQIPQDVQDRKSTRLNSSHLVISYAVFCLKKKKTTLQPHAHSRTDR